jgi:histone deacetylase 6
LYLPCQPVTKETVCLVHSSEHYQRMLATSQLSDRKLKKLEVEDDLYFCRNTFMAARLACGGTVQCVNAVTDAFRTGVGSSRAIALVRPPGHHALRDSPMGKFAFSLS